MRIISKSTLVEYYTKNPQSKTALEEWYEKTKNLPPRRYISVLLEHIQSMTQLRT